MSLEWHSRGRGFDSPWLHQFQVSVIRCQSSDRDVFSALQPPMLRACLGLCHDELASERQMSLQHYAVAAARRS